MTSARPEWQEQFADIVSHLSDGILTEAKQKDKWGEAITYVKKQRSKGLNTAKTDFELAVKRVQDIVCDYTLIRLNDEMKESLINRGNKS